MPWLGEWSDQRGRQVESQRERRTLIAIWKQWVPWNSSLAGKSPTGVAFEVLLLLLWTRLTELHPWHNEEGRRRWSFSTHRGLSYRCSRTWPLTLSNREWNRVFKICMFSSASVKRCPGCWGGRGGRGGVFYIIFTEICECDALKQSHWEQRGRVHRCVCARVCVGV